MSVLKKQVGSASQILASYAMGIVKKEIDCMMQELMVMGLSSVMLDEAGQKNLNTDLQYRVACPPLITSMVQEWKEEILLVTNKRKAEKEKVMEAELNRVRKLGQQVSAVCCSNTTSAQSSANSSSSDVNSANYSDESNSCVAGNCNEETAGKRKIVQAELNRVRKLRQQVSAMHCSNTTSAQSSAYSSCSDVNSASYSDESNSCVAGNCNEETAGKSTIIQDFMQLHYISDCQMMETQNSVSEQGSQTLSTGRILYLNCLSDV
jgi:hypothetical protein